MELQITCVCARQFWRRLGIPCFRLVSSPTGSIPWRLSPAPRAIQGYNSVTLRTMSVLAAIFCPLIWSTSIYSNNCYSVLIILLTIVRDDDFVSQYLH